MKKKLTCFIIICTMILSSCVYVFGYDSGDTSTDTSFNIENYEQYTVDFSKVPATRAASADTIDFAMQYVKSLDLPSRDFAYIEEACLAELAQYDSADVELNSYTILVPKAASTKKFYGSYGGHDFYYDTTSTSSFTKSTNGTKKSSSNASTWAKWVSGALNVSVGFLSKKISIPYSIIGAVIGIYKPADINYGAYNEYVKTGGSSSTSNPVKTRSIYRKSGSTYRLAYQDQTGPLKLTLVFHPADTALKTSYDIKNIYNETSVRSTTYSKNSILKIANTQANHGSKVTYLLSSVKIKESW